MDDTTKAFIVNEHNRLRRLTQASDMLLMSWDDEAAQLAQNWANQCILGHPSNDQKSTYLTTSSKFDQSNRNNNVRLNLNLH